MKPEELGEKLKTRLRHDLPGFAAHIEMTPYRQVYNNKVPDDARKSAVLIHICNFDGEAVILLIRRPDYEGVHSGQVSFPGGRKEESDKNLLHTAIRETREEVGFEVKSSAIIGELTSLYIPPSRSLVFPFVSVGDTVPVIIPEPREVAHYFYLPLRTLLDEKSMGVREIRISEGRIIPDVPCFIYGEEIIWGATSAILNELKKLLQEIIP